VHRSGERSDRRRHDYDHAVRPSPGRRRDSPSAQVLGTGSATQTVSNGGVAPSITVFISGQIGSIGLTPAFASVPADGTTSTAVFAIDPRDFGNQPIKAGTKDPYANPIAATLTAVAVTRRCS